MTRWQPGARPDWVADRIAVGRGLGATALHPLDGDELLGTAAAIAGTDDMGGDTWRDGFDRLLTALRDEARLHAVGAELVRTELLRTLVNRLRIVAAPTPPTDEIRAPWFVTGTARSGTSILHELLALDPTARTPGTWEVLSSTPAPHPDAPDPERLARADAEVQLWNRITPEYLTMHENGGALPTECIFLTAHEFASEHWSGVHDVPSYNRWLVRGDLAPAYRWHRRHLAFLQSAHEPRRWVLKAPSHLGALGPLFREYPDAWVIRTHRDPRETVPSTISLMATLRWMRSDDVDVDRLTRTMTEGVAVLFDFVDEQVDAGAIPAGRVVDIRYADLVTDPVATVARVYEATDIELPPQMPDAIREYVAARPRGRHGRHRYDLATFGIDERALAERYTRYVTRYLAA